MIEIKIFILIRQWGPWTGSSNPPERKYNVVVNTFKYKEMDILYSFWRLQL